MNYDIKHTCGHKKTIQLFGKMEDRERKIKWLEEQDCSDCQKKEKGIIVKIRLSKKEGQEVIKMTLEGDTFDSKDLIKKIGYKWNMMEKIWEKEMPIIGLETSSQMDMELRTLEKKITYIMVDYGNVEVTCDNGMFNPVK